MIQVEFIGTGGVARQHRTAIDRIEDADLTAVYHLNEAFARKTAKASDATVCESASEVIDRRDAVYILTPPRTHRDLAVEALKARKHVMCEKPLAITLDDGQAIVKAASESSTRFVIAFSQRFRDSYRRMREIYRSGKLGEATTFYYRRMFSGGSYNPDNWRNPPDSRCGMSIESLSHKIDLVRWSMGEIESVYAKAIASFEELPDVDNNIHAILNLTSGCVAMLHLSWSSYISLNYTGSMARRARFASTEAVT
ncbi:MAG: hypothetical protein CME19_09680 [Gemmatimonadetes bacterium]|nr:hypothetical protein [Gemmatimonadota bacterium]|tara:strand:+ start:311 stop:1072 length:762 start_codon:yes stop_codon:yes gene_type:complete